MIDQVMQVGYEQGKELLSKAENGKEKVERAETGKASERTKGKEKNMSATVELSGAKKKNATYFKPDMEKIRKMQAESQQRMLEKMLGTARDSFIKQAGGLKNILEQTLSGKKTEGFDINLKAEDIEKAKANVAEGGYWSAENTASRLVEFAKALSGDDAKQADKLMSAIKKGFEQAEELWGDKLPQITQDTYRLTMKKLENWKKETKI